MRNMWAHDLCYRNTEQKVNLLKKTKKHIYLKITLIGYMHFQELVVATQWCDTLAARDDHSVKITNL